MGLKARGKTGLIESTSMCISSALLPPTGTLSRGVKSGSAHHAPVRETEHCGGGAGGGEWGGLWRFAELG